MGREIRRVPEGWEHPKDREDHYQPMHDSTYLERLIDHLREDLGWYLWPPKHWQHIKKWATGFPDKRYCRPFWRESEATHYQVYETVTEGTPVSPVFTTLEEMKEWLLAKGFSERASSRFVKSGYAPSMIFSPGRGVSRTGIHSLDWLND